MNTPPTRWHTALTILVTALLIVAAVLVCGCMTTSGGGSSVTPLQAVRQESRAQGEGEFGSLFVGPFPLTYPLRWRGNGTITLQYPQTPHVVFNGTADFIVEPIAPEYVDRAHADVAAGRVVIFRNGQRTGLAPVGTVRAFRTNQYETIEVEPKEEAEAPAMDSPSFPPPAGG